MSPRENRKRKKEQGDWPTCNANVFHNLMKLSAKGKIKSSNNTSKDTKVVPQICCRGCSWRTFEWGEEMLYLTPKSYIFVRVADTADLCYTVLFFAGGDEFWTMHPKSQCRNSQHCDVSTIS